MKRLFDGATALVLAAIISVIGLLPGTAFAQFDHTHVAWTALLKKQSDH